MGMSRPASLSERLRRGRRERSAVRSASNLDDLVVITGFSGAGKSTAMAVFEDAGYFCVDNLPPEMIRSLAELFMHEGSKVESAAVVSDVRGGAYFEGLVKVLDELESSGLVYRVIFLEADDQTLLNRYKETRRRHPLAPIGQRRGGDRRRARAARAAQGARRRGRRHERAERRSCCGASSPTSCCPQRDAGQARRHVHLVRPQARPAARRRPRLRRALPAQPALRGRAAAR